MKRLRFIRPIGRISSGDTIVEVLIAILVISFILVGAYALSSHSTKTLRDTQEHQIALDLASDQVEHLRANYGLDTSIYNCFDSDGLAASATSGENGCDYNDDTSSGCIATTGHYCYKVRIVALNSTSSAPTNPTIATTYRVDVTWPSQLSGTASESSYYRAYSLNPNYTPPLPPPGTPNPPPINGPPGIGGKACPPLPTGRCKSTSSQNPKWRWSVILINRTTQIPASQIAGCQWNFGDGSPVVNNKWCHLNDVVNPPHTFPQIPEPPINPNLGCSTPHVKKVYDVTLVIIRTDGSRSTVARYTVTLPRCW